MMEGIFDKDQATEEPDEVKASCLVLKMSCPGNRAA